MRCTAYYAIIPMGRLTTKFIAIEADLREMLLEPSLWSHEQPTHSSFTRDDYLSGAKTIFITHLELTYLHRGALSSLFEVPASTPPEELFDLGWTMLYFEGVGFDMSDAVRDIVATAGSGADADIPGPFRY